MLESEKAALVFFTTGNITSEYKDFDRIIKQFRGPLTIGVFKLSPEEAQSKEFKLRYKLTNTKFPQLRFYKNLL